MHANLYFVQAVACTGDLDMYFYLNCYDFKKNMSQIILDNMMFKQWFLHFKTVFWISFQ